MVCKSMASVVAVATLAAVPLVGRGVTLSVDKVQQRYPWNGLVDVDYTVSYADGEAVLDPALDRLRITVINNKVSPPTSNVAVRVDVHNGIMGKYGALPTSAGTHRVTWDANGDGVWFASDKVSLELSAVSYRPKYLVINVSEGPSAKNFPVEVIDGTPLDGTNVDKYKGDFILLRYIPAGAYVAGSPETPVREFGRVSNREVMHNVVHSRGFYMGVFEITQRQYERVTGQMPSSTGNAGLFRPVEQVSYDNIRGSNLGSKWPATNEVDEDSFLGILREKTKSSGNYDFDIPTEFQWEYACRAGTTGTFYPGNDIAATEAECLSQIADIGRCSQNTGDGKGGAYSTHTIVGSYFPNAHGVYDMIGNVCEWCRDWNQENVDILGQVVDPRGPQNGVGQSPTRCVRGGAFGSAAKDCRTAKRGGLYSYFTDKTVGFRISCDQP